MTDRPDMHTAALARVPIPIRIEDADGRLLRETTVLPLWEEGTDPKSARYNREAWRCLEFTETGGARATLLFAGGLRCATSSECPPRIEPVDPAHVPAPNAPAFPEFIALCSRFRLGARWSYTKPGEQPEWRRGVPSGFNGTLLFADDADRQGAPRSFRLDRLTDLVLIEQPLPRWTSAGYRREEDPRCPF